MSPAAGRATLPFPTGTCPSLEREGRRRPPPEFTGVALLQGCPSHQPMKAAERGGFESCLTDWRRGRDYLVTASLASPQQQQRPQSVKGSSSYLFLLEPEAAPWQECAFGVWESLLGREELPSYSEVSGSAAGRLASSSRPGAEGSLGRASAWQSGWLGPGELNAQGQPPCRSRAALFRFRVSGSGSGRGASASSPAPSEFGAAIAKGSRRSPVNVCRP